MSQTPVIGWAAQIDTRIWQAVLAGAFVAGGWLYNGWQNRRDASRLRAERLRDVHRALFAEIGTISANMTSAASLAQDAEPIIERMRADANFVPFIPREHGDHLYDAIVAEIHILPRCTIDPVVAYYTQIKTLCAHADDMRGEAFKLMVQDRRIAMYRDYIAMKEQLLEFGLYATAMIKAYGEGGEAAAEKLRQRINSRVAAQFGPSQGSA